MSKEEFNSLEIGVHVWVCRLSFSHTGTNTLGLFAELEKTANDKFLVVSVEKGTTLKAGQNVSSGYYHTFDWYHTYKTRKEAIEEWNKKVYNTIDMLTSTYEQTVKKVKKKLLKE